MPAGRRWIFHTLRVTNFRGNHVAKFSSDLTMPRESPYCLSRTRLAQIQDACSAYELEVTAEMELWTPEEAKEYFASRGAIRPAADQMSHRTREDRAAPLDKTGARDARREACLTILCPCDGGLVSMIWDQCAPLCCPRREPRLQRGDG